MSDKQFSRAKLESLGEGRFRLSGALNAVTAGRLLKDSSERFRHATRIEIDLAGVSDADSAGLALLIEWMRIAKQEKAEIRFEHVPAQINALARISEVDDLLFNGAAPAAVDAASA